MKFFLVLLSVGLFAAPVPQPCSSRTINVNSEWSMPLTALTANQDCDFTFNVPAGSFAVVDVNAAGVGYYDSIYIHDSFGDSEMKMSKDKTTFTSSKAWPGSSVTVNLRTPDTTTLQVQMKVTVKKANPQANVVSKVSTSTNSPSSLIYTNDWVEGSSYTFTSQGAKIDIKTAGLDGGYDFINVFVYDGGKLVGTLLQNFVSTSNTVTLYLAKKISSKSAVLITDSSNLKNVERHYVTYVPLQKDARSDTHLLSGEESLEGALTIIGDKNGATPVDVTAFRNLDDLNGSFSVVAGGPLASHPNAAPLAGSLPKRLSGNFNTVFLSRGRGTVSYNVV